MQQYMVQIINNLEKKGYRKLNPDSNNVYGRAEGDTVYVVVIGSDRNLDAESLEKFNSKIIWDVKSHSPLSIKLLNILITPTGMFSETTKKIASDVENVWLFTEDYGKLYIYENQPADFDNLYDVIDKQIVVENEKSVRHLVNMFGIVTPVLVLLNVLVYIAGKYGAGISDEFLLEYKLAINVQAIHEGREYYRFLTSIFTHFGMAHLFGNMVVLIALGARVESIAGHISYIVIYLFTGLTAAFASYMNCLHKDTYDYAAGASGAIFGLLGVLFVIAVMNKGRVKDLSLMNMFILFILTVMNGVLAEGIDNVAHVAGFISGMFAGLLLMLTNQKVVNRSRM